jgi:hypothetical protein
VVTPVLAIVKFGLTVRASVVVCVKAPEVPVIVTVAVPDVAVALAVSVMTLVVVVLVGLNAAVTPLGKPEAVRATLPVNPFDGFTVTVLVPFVLTLSARLPGESVKVKSGGPVTVNAIVVVAVTAPDVPLMVTVAVPAAAEAPAVNVTTLLEADEVGLNAAVTPLGKPEAVNATVPVNPFWSLTVMVLVPPASPGVIDKVLGDAESVNVGGPVTVNEMVVLAVVVPDVPVIVTVEVPAATPEFAVSVSTLLVVDDVGLNAAVTPLGRPVAVNVTVPVNPPTGFTVIVLVPPAPPGVIDKLLGEADRVKPEVRGRLNSQMPRP